MNSPYPGQYTSFDEMDKQDAIRRSNAQSESSGQSAYSQYIQQKMQQDMPTFTNADLPSTDPSDKARYNNDMIIRNEAGVPLRDTLAGNTNTQTDTGDPYTKLVNKHAAFEKAYPAVIQDESYNAFKKSGLESAYKQSTLAQTAKTQDMANEDRDLLRAANFQEKTRLGEEKTRLEKEKAIKKEKEQYTKQTTNTTQEQTAQSARNITMNSIDYLLNNPDKAKNVVGFLDRGLINAQKVVGYSPEAEADASLAMFKSGVFLEAGKQLTGIEQKVLEPLYTLSPATTTDTEFLVALKKARETIGQKTYEHYKNKGLNIKPFNQWTKEKPKGTFADYTQYIEDTKTSGLDAIGGQSSQQPPSQPQIVMYKGKKYTRTEKGLQPYE